MLANVGTIQLHHSTFDIRYLNFHRASVVFIRYSPVVCSAGHQPIPRQCIKTQSQYDRAIDQRSSPAAYDLPTNNRSLSCTLRIVSPRDHSRFLSLVVWLEAVGVCVCVGKDKYLRRNVLMLRVSAYIAFRPLKHIGRRSASSDRRPRTKRPRRRH